MQVWFEAATCEEGHACVGGGHIDFQTSDVKMSSGSGASKTSLWC